MMRREVEIPEGAISQFERIVSELGGKIVAPIEPEKFESPEAQWKWEVTHARSLVDQLTRRTDPNRRAKSSQGLGVFIYESFKWDRSRLRDKFPLNDLCEGLQLLFSGYLQDIDSLPSDVRVQNKREDRFHFIRGWGRLTKALTPHDITFAIESYGLVDGQLRSDHEIARRYLTTQSTVYNSLDRVRARVAQDARI